MPTKRQATSSRGVRGRLRSLDNMSNNARSIDDRRSPLNTAIVARRLFVGTTIVARPWSLSLNRTQVLPGPSCHIIGASHSSGQMKLRDPTLMTQIGHWAHANV
ncbi:hypothetical protein DPMN_089917 [Dreissena polymorpha]|uniref:Uncharacterized protein n=1 Tax=Dreissena polymorpha TaxID=45954 RepID=A0A9D4QZB8_DREPO|nr:hypothetical protein DPMN_089917 [Dreissena polymorpha]